MDRKTFIITGLFLIHLHFILTIASTYLAFSGMNSEHFGNIHVTLFMLLIFGLGFLLFKRFQTTEVTYWALIPCWIIFGQSIAVVLPFITWYFENVFHESGAQTRFFDAISVHYKLGRDGSPFTVQHKLDYILVLLPATYANYFSYYLLLLLGYFDPRILSKNRTIRYLQRAFTRRGETKVDNKAGFTQSNFV